MEEVRVLSLETSTELCSAAIYTPQQVFVRHQHAPKEHSKLLLKMVDELLDEANFKLRDDISALAYGAGPGSFTGLRIAASVVQGLSFGIKRPVIAVSTLQALAQAAWRRFGYLQVLAILDARMEEIYFGFYKLDSNNIMQNCGKDNISAIGGVLGTLPSEFHTENWYSVGTLAVAYREYLKECMPNIVNESSLLYPSALEVAMIAKEVYLKEGGMSAENAVPIYLRNQVVEKSEQFLSRLT